MMFLLRSPKGNVRAPSSPSLFRTQHPGCRGNRSVLRRLRAFPSLAGGSFRSFGTAPLEHPRRGWQTPHLLRLQNSGRGWSQRRSATRIPTSLRLPARWTVFVPLFAAFTTIIGQPPAGASNVSLGPNPAALAESITFAISAGEGCPKVEVSLPRLNQILDQAKEQWGTDPSDYLPDGRFRDTVRAAVSSAKAQLKDDLLKFCANAEHQYGPGGSGLLNRRLMQLQSSTSPESDLQIRLGVLRPSSSEYVRQPLSVVNLGSRTYGSVKVECGFFRDEILLAADSVWVDNVGPRQTAHKEVLVNGARGATRAECRVAETR